MRITGITVGLLRKDPIDYNVENIGLTLMIKNGKGEVTRSELMTLSNYLKQGSKAN